MAQNFVNNLPTELLLQVFKYLNDFERATAAKVCNRWFTILPSERYLETLELDYQRLETQFDDAKRYRSVSIVSRPNYEEIESLQRYMRDKEVMSNLEELYIDLREVHWFDLFEYGTEECYYPKLRKLALDNYVEDFFRLPFPEWLRPRQNIPISKWIFSDKIETLEIINSPLLVTPNAEQFPNLRSLTLIDIQQISFEDSFKLVTCRLNELKVISIDSLSLEKLIDNARELKSLSISGHLPISATAFDAINNMKKLQQLTHTIPITGTVKGLSLPFLEKLEVFADGLIPLDSVPNLRSLCIRGNPFWNEAIICKKWADYYRLFGQQLQHLSLNSMFLDTDYVSQICTLRNLQTMKVTTSDVEFTELEKICQSVGNLKLLRLEGCAVAVEIIRCVKTSGCACECELCMGLFNPFDPDPYKTCAIMERRFSNLRALYVDCAISTVGCKFIKQVVSRYRNIRCFPVF